MSIFPLGKFLCMAHIIYTAAEFVDGFFDKFIFGNLSRCQAEGTPPETIGGANEEVEK